METKQQASKHPGYKEPPLEPNTEMHLWESRYDTANHILRLCCKCSNITASTVREHKEFFAMKWAQLTEAKGLEVNIESVNFIDSSGMGFLVYLFKLASDRGVNSFKLLKVNENVANVIRLANMDAVLGLEQSNGMA